MAEAPEWLVVGADVVEFTPSRSGVVGAGRTVRSKVARIGKRDVVLANGSRYPVATLRSRTRDAWSPTTALLSPSDPVVERALAANAATRRRGEVSAACEQWQRSRTAEAAEQLRDAAAAFLAGEP